MKSSIQSTLALALLPMAPKGSVVNKIAAPYAPTAVDPNIQQRWDRAVQIEQELPEMLRGVFL